MDEAVQRAWQSFAQEADWEHLSPTDLERFGEFVRHAVDAGAERPDFGTLVPASAVSAGESASLVERLDGLYEVSAAFWRGRRERA